MTWALRALPPELARALLALLASLLVLAHAPVVLGWTSVAVASDSMAPRLRAGDVLVVSPVRAEQLALGQVLLVDDPARPGELLSHRLSGVDQDGSLVLRGDANTSDDSSPVPLSAVHGVGRLRVPLVGLPATWGTPGRSFAVLAAGLLLVLARPGRWRPTPRPGRAR